MDRITKTISMDKRIADTVLEIAQRERRSFTKQVEIMLEEHVESMEQANRPEAS